MKFGSGAGRWNRHKKGKKKRNKKHPPPQLLRNLTTSKVICIVYATDKLNVLRISTAEEQERRYLSFVSAERKMSERVACCHASSRLASVYLARRARRAKYRSEEHTSE